MKEYQLTARAQALRNRMVEQPAVCTELAGNLLQTGKFHAEDELIGHAGLPHLGSHHSVHGSPQLQLYFLYRVLCSHLVEWDSVAYCSLYRSICWS